jgi:TPR repeat protein
MMTDVVMSEAVAAVELPEPASAEAMFERGMMYASDRTMPADLVRAHQWFNLAAMLGCAEATQLRREIAAEMTDAQIGQAQRAARDWLKANPVQRAPQLPQLRAAA